MLALTMLALPMLKDGDLVGAVADHRFSGEGWNPRDGARED
jgi:hypothetical protein